MKMIGTVRALALVAATFALVACESDGGGTMQTAATSGTKMYGAQLTSPQNASAKGDATVTVDRASKTASWKVNYSGLSGPATMAHFHGPAGAGQNAPPVVWLSPQGQPVPANTIEGRQQLTDAQLADLEAGRYYINVHTQANPGGEIRGQVMPK